MNMKKIILFLTFAGLIYGQITSIPSSPYWRIVKQPGTLASRPATCTANRDVYVCNGAGCTTNGEYHYCTAANTWTVASGASVSPAEVGTGAVNDIPSYNTTTTLAPAATGTFYWNSQLFVKKNGIGETPTFGLSLGNDTAAAAGAQQWSPCIEQYGYGWKTDATAGSQKVQWRRCIVPVQGAAAPQARLDFSYAINGGSFATTMSLLNGLVGINTSTLASYTLDVVDLTGGVTNGIRTRSSDLSNELSMGWAGFRSGNNIGFIPGSGLYTLWIGSSNSVGVGPSNTSPSGTLSVYDATATTGATTQKIKAGAGQSTTDLQQWLNNSDVVLAKVTSAGEFVSVGAAGTGGSVTLTGYTFANLPTTGQASTNGTMVYCSDCLRGTAVCTDAGGTGTFAFRLNGAWSCL